MRFSSAGFTQQSPEGEKRCLNSELWHSCAGPLVSLPAVGSRMVYFSQGHSEQVTASTNKEVDAHIPNDPSLSPQLICQLHNVTMHVYVETDEVNAQMTLQPLSPGDNAPPPLTSFEATGFPSELLREVVLARSLQPKSSSKNVFMVVEFALALQEAGCFSVVLKCALAIVAAATATSALRIPTIGIGVGTFYSGQVN